MDTKYIFTILCGDKRQLEMARLLLERGHRVRIYGVEDAHNLNGASIYTNWKNAVEGCDVILLPLPVTRDGETINISASLDISPIYLNELYAIACKSKCGFILGGILPSDIENQCDEKIKIIDYYKDELLQRKNAIPSAEGALMIAMQHTDTTVKNMPVLVLGYGRIAAYLSKILYCLGADVTVAARSVEAIKSAKDNGYNTVILGSDEMALTEAFDKTRVVFNTIPSVIFTRSMIDNLNSKPLYIEIASNKGGIDMSAARNKGIEVICAPSIPAKYSPVTAGRYIFETITEILAKRGLEI